MFARQILKAAIPLASRRAGPALKVAAAALTTSRVTIEQAKNMPRNYPEMPNDVLLTMAIMGDQDAREERMIREIMSVDNVSW
jgi:hypothetical protein